MTQTNAGVVDGEDARGTSASFVCGSFVTVSVTIDESAGAIAEARFKTNGCGFMIAASDVICGWLCGKKLADMHGLNDTELMDVVSDELGELPPGRGHCAAIVFEALRSAMAAYRARRIEEFQGEKALICTCFGVSEDTVIETISRNSISNVDVVADISRAGSGCGSCRMLIQELIDDHARRVVF